VKPKEEEAKTIKLNATQRMPMNAQGTKVALDKFSNLERSTLRNSSLFNQSQGARSCSKPNRLYQVKCTLRSHMDSIRALQFV
jgi:hypothetical protein